jgi:NAD(P)-dependent dehydrogenase (short-subunit alcohol dehydrogenase family)
VDTDNADAEALEQRMTQAADLGTFRVLVNKPGRWLLSPQYPEGRKWRRSVDLNVVMPMLAAQLAVRLTVTRAVVRFSSLGLDGGPQLPSGSAH